MTDKRIIRRYSHWLELYYREPYYWWVNTFLRTGRFPAPGKYGSRAEPVDEIKSFQIIEQLTEMFDAIDPIDKPCLVYKGIGLDFISSLSEVPQFQSCSTKPKIAERFLNDRNCCMLEITLPVGFKALFTENQLGEVILNRDTIFNIIDPTPHDVDGIHYYNATVLKLSSLSSVKDIIAQSRKSEDRIRKIMAERESSKSLEERVEDLALEYKILEEDLSEDGFFDYIREHSPDLLDLDEASIKYLFENTNVD